MKLIEGSSKIIEYLKDCKETIYLTVGFRWKSPTTMDVPMTADEAIKYLEENRGHYALVELEIHKDNKHNLNCYTSNDMW